MAKPIYRLMYLSVDIAFELEYLQMYKQLLVCKYNNKNVFYIFLPFCILSLKEL